MNPFESALVSALRHEAEEIEMSTDLNDGREILDSRLDDVDRRRRRWQVVGGLVAVAAVGVVAVLVGVTRPTATPAPPATTPSTGPSASQLTAGPFRSVAFEPTMTWSPPVWTAQPNIESSDRTGHVTWSVGGDCGQRCAETGFVAVDEAPSYADRSPVSVDTPAEFVANLRTLQYAGALLVTDERPVTVGGLRGTSFQVQESSFVEGGLGCVGTTSSRDCYGTAGGWTSWYVVLDDDGRTMLVFMTTRNDNPDLDAYKAQFQAALDTVRFD